MSILQTIDLKKYYGTEPNITKALDGVNFSVEEGEFVAVVGISYFVSFAIFLKCPRFVTIQVKIP